MDLVRLLAEGLNIGRVINWLCCGYRHHQIRHNFQRAQGSDFYQHEHARAKTRRQSGMPCQNVSV